MVLATTSMVTVSGGSATAGVLLDQSFDPQPNPTLSASANSAVDAAQTFTVGVTGTLSSIDLFLARYSSTPVGNFTIELLSTTNGTPNEGSSAILFQESFPETSLTTTDAFFGVDVSAAGIHVAIGDVYAIALFYNGIPGIEWRGDASGYFKPLYTHGDGFARLHSGSNTWQSFTSSQGFTGDYGFMTYVNSASSASVPEPSTLALLSLGAIGLAFGAFRRRRVAAFRSTTYKLNAV